MKKNKKGKKLKKIFFLIILFITYIWTLKGLEKIDLDVKNDFFYKFLINNSSSLNSENIISYDKFKEMVNFQPNRLLSNKFVYTDTKELAQVEKSDTSSEEKAKNDEVVVQEVKKDPIVYIYNTHQTENYSGKYLADYSITPTVMIASYMLKENLEEYGIYSYVEEDSVSAILKKNNWKYASSYKVTKGFIEKRSKEMNSIKYYIDLHRDSVKKKYTTTEINGVSYAKVMLLVGLEHDNYQANLKEAQKINNKLNKEYPSLSRGIYKKSGKGVNGIYNQDVSKYAFLFEVGGVDNDISEVNNTITVLAKIIAEYIKEEGDVKY